MIQNLFCARAKYIPDPVTGALRLAMVQGFSHPVFNSDPKKKAPTPTEVLLDGADEHLFVFSGRVGEPSPEDIERATRRAKIAAFDKILCTPDLDTFATFTFAPDENRDRADYSDVYDILKPWLSNRVQRRGLKYVIVPERHHESNGIHFHAIMNSDALQLERARSAKSGRALTNHGNPLYNVTDWHAGFSSAEIIKNASIDREKVAKYIFKYMGKQVGAKIGGRYVLTGGDLGKPVYIYSDSVENLCGDDCKYSREIEIPGGGHYMEYSFI